MNQTDSNNGTPFNAEQELLAWSQTRPNWQRDALRRIFVNGQLTEQDFDQLEVICCDPEAAFDPLCETHVQLDDISGEPVSLLKISELVGVNALVSNQALNLSPTGITIVYGDNGAGKSGYVRVLKDACRSRDSKLSILPDIKSGTADTQSAKITYREGSKEHQIEWQPNSAARSQLPLVSIFDSRSATTHVQAENKVAYIPRPMKILEALAQACDILNARLQERSSQIASQTPVILSSNSLSKDTAAGSFLAKLEHDSSPANLDVLTTLSEDEQKRLATLETDLAQDPNRIVAKLVNLQQRTNGLFLKLKILLEGASSSNAVNLKVKRTQLRAAQEASKASSDSLFASSPLPDIGGEAWKLLWEAARKYSDEIAYHEQKFPQVNDGDLCVLCQHPLDENAKTRMQTFENFVTSTTKQEENTAQQSLEQAIQCLKAVLPADNFAIDCLSLIRDELADEPLATLVNQLIDDAISRIQSFIEDKETSRAEPAYPEEAIKTHTEQLQKRIDELNAASAAEARQALIAEHKELKDRTLLADLKADIKAEIGRRGQIEKLKQAAKLTAKRTVTTKNKELSDKLVTDALRGRFAREVEKLKIGSIPLELKKTKDSNAQSFFQVEFVGYPGKPVGEVLSEGEHRCVALAAFLAELVTSREYSGIVFDDPMSSLDHLYRQKVARRLTEEAQHRQVVVFTHDLPFLFELNRECEAQGMTPHFQNISKRAGQPGFVSGDKPMKAKKSPEMAQSLFTELKSMKGEFLTANEMRRTLLAKGFIELLRETWDQVIADMIAPVLGRFDPQIKGSSLFKLLDLTPQHVEAITTARARLSEDLHVAPAALNPETVTFEELENEAKAVQDWLQTWDNRQKTPQPRISVI